MYFNYNFGQSFCGYQLQFANLIGIRIFQINENLEGEIKFLAQTGPFSVPLKIYKKKCELKASVERLDFGQLCIGEKNTMILTLTNNGALETDYEITRIIGTKI